MYEIVPEGEGYRIIEDGAGPGQNVPSLMDMINRLLALVHAKALSHFEGTLRIHAGYGEREGRRFIVVGDKGTGKSTLMMKLLLGGFRITGDELVLVKDGEAFPFPRKFHIKEGSVPLLPEMAGLFETLPWNDTTYGQKMFSFSPMDIGREWKVDAGKIDAILHLEPNHGKKTYIEECPKYRMVERVMPMTYLSETEDHRKIPEVCRIVDEADCYVLGIGHLEGAVDALHRKMTVI